MIYVGFILNLPICDYNLDASAVGLPLEPWIGYGSYSGATLSD